MTQKTILLENIGGAESLGCSFASPKAFQDGEALPIFPLSGEAITSDDDTAGKKHLFT